MRSFVAYQLADRGRQPSCDPDRLDLTLRTLERRDRQAHGFFVERIGLRADLQHAVERLDRGVIDPFPPAGRGGS